MNTNLFLFCLIRLSKKNGAKYFKTTRPLAAGGRDGVRVGRGRPLDHRLRVRRHLVHRPCPPHPRSPVPAGAVHDRGRGLPRGHLQLLVDLVQAGVHAGGLPVLADSGRNYIIKLLL